MKPQMIAGILVAGLGAFIVLRGLNYGSERNTMRVGDFQASVETRRAIPPWVGAVAIVGGLLLMGVGVSRRRGSA
jgi:drug/metabolite transporter (DMT)-like permease